MVIDIRGVNTHNKGAELMMHSVASALGERFPLCASPNGSSFDVRASLQLKQTLTINQAPRLTASAGNLVPKGLAQAYGIARSKDVTGVVDASGFAYSDSFSTKRSQREARQAAKWHKKGLPFVMLPQAFGPFNNADQAMWSEKLLSHADVVYARDEISLDFVRKLGTHIRVRKAPDFTIGLKVDHLESRVCGEFGSLVPNSKVISHTPLSEEAYLEFLSRAGLEMRAIGLQVVIVVHEDSDLILAQKLVDRLGAELFVDSSPLVLKKVLGESKLVVASRYHAVVSALSQGTPALAFGWSHKYQELMNDFNVSEWLLKSTDSFPSDLMTSMLKESMSSQLTEARLRLLSANTEMWSEIVEILSRTNQASS
ncbi:polysaccharide pyruvyl transferase family protein [Arthrobacter sp. TMT4-20]